MFAVFASAINVQLEAGPCWKLRDTVQGTYYFWWQSSETREPKYCIHYTLSVYTYVDISSSFQRITL
jgi:hypothetical protein